MKFALLAALCLNAFAFNLPPRPRNTRVYDQANVLTPSGRRQLQTITDQLAQKDAGRMFVATVTSLQGLDVADFTNRLFRGWQLGGAGKDDGVLLLVCPQERKARIEVGYGLEAKLTDLQAGQILKDEMHGPFAAGKFEEGLLIGADRVSAILMGQAPAPSPRSSNNPPPPWVIIPFLSIFFFVGGLMTRSKVWVIAVMFTAMPALFAYVSGANWYFFPFVWLFGLLLGAKVKLTPGRGRSSSSGWSSGSDDSDSGSSGSDSGDFGGSSGGGGASDSF